MHHQFGTHFNFKRLRLQHQGGRMFFSGWWSSMALANLTIAPGSPSVASTAIDSDTDPEAPEAPVSGTGWQLGSWRASWKPYVTCFPLGSGYKLLHESWIMNHSWIIHLQRPAKNQKHLCEIRCSSTPGGARSPRAVAPWGVDQCGLRERSGGWMCWGCHGIDMD